MRMRQAVFILWASAVLCPCPWAWSDDSHLAIGEIKSLVKSMDLSSAFERSQEIRDPKLRDQALRFVAKTQFSSGDYPSAVTSAVYISDNKLRDRELRRMAQTAALGSRDKFDSGGAGGGAEADFDTLIELIQTTVEPETWDEIGGPGAASGFPGGVLVDTRGVLSRVELTQSERHAGTIRSMSSGDRNGATHNREAAQAEDTSTPLRKVSLRRLEQQLQRLAALGKPAEPAMRSLGGMVRIEYFAVTDVGSPDADIVLVGPGLHQANMGRASMRQANMGRANMGRANMRRGNMHQDSLREQGAGEGATADENLFEKVDPERPTLQLDDLVVLMRNAFSGDGVFGCSITPRQANLASAQRYLNETSDKPLPPNQRDKWLDGLRDQLGEQDITVHGFDPGTRVSRVVVEADYRMKLVGMGIEASVPGVASYLDRVTLGPDGGVAPLTVLRWWFALTNEMIRTNSRRDVFRLPKQSVRVLSENELLTETGQRVPTGDSDPLNEAFARDFNEHFPEIASASPIYAELQNVFDLALVAAVLKSEDLPAKIGWQMTYFGSPKNSSWLVHRPALRESPRSVETVLSHRILNRKHIVAGVSGGVRFQREKSPAISMVPGERLEVSDRPADPSVWWWD